ncbi:hypothetical protein AP75_06975 [Kaistella haifensis DSM 19056]|uniref:Glycosyltransferase 2-like domain-containing protein n=1 Tax=Kaistella haifensis DSM 19056 TaxID=1450526 RepID=A0A2D0A6M7_9FLAO|nr:glycosyltransferase [Kaistella haifensis]OWK98334.1 hypothetical protein AP75_06975 [Kaistella haifensis DSM 19056]
MKYSFNYIITIHNKEHLINDVLAGIKNCASQDSKIYPVLDGCTDNSEQIIDEFSLNNPELEIIKIYENDVHELRAINAALKKNSYNGKPQLNIILQDDVVLNDKFLENHLEKLFSNFVDVLGVVSLRHGGDLSSFLLKKESSIFPIRNYIETVFGHGVSGNIKDLEEGCFVFRDVAIKSPICISSQLINKIGFPDEVYQPWDDIAYCYKALQNGCRNGVLSANFISEKEWGTMRNKKQQQKHDDIVIKNLKTFRKLNAATLDDFFTKRRIDKNIYRIWDAPKISKPRYFIYAKSIISQTLYKTKLIFKK